jgi:hypothetical protein
MNLPTGKFKEGDMVVVSHPLSNGLHGHDYRGMTGIILSISSTGGPWPIRVAIPELHPEYNAEYTMWREEELELVPTPEVHIDEPPVKPQSCLRRWFALP